MKTLIKAAQNECFSQKLHDLRKNIPIKSKECLLGLNPFIDAEGLIRVGGSLQLSEFEFEKKHPMIMSAKHRLTILIFAYEHVRLLHAGPQLLLSSIRERYWPLRGRNLAKKYSPQMHKMFSCQANTQMSHYGCFARIACSSNASILFDRGRLCRAIFKSKQGRGAKLSKCYIIYSIYSSII
ncbi:hypothetical protein NQ314_011624 [Rhamnusium bicolor]|uniref:Integrase zinc-binding domain-containing protein n=1 Tax=Rhamnusium bicolor TaxID=1586634 RepID=A0AAV8XHU0_9CUCU|nr:hypothetical protein NQ314_011624 [Rhamnusium bicolor]